VNYPEGYNSSLTFSPSVVSFSPASGGVSRVPAAALARVLESAAAMSDCRRPSLDSRCANFAISLSYSSHSGIWRARASLGSFCEHQNTIVSSCITLDAVTMRTVNGFWHKSMVLARSKRSLLPVNCRLCEHSDGDAQVFSTYTTFHTSVEIRVSV